MELLKQLGFPDDQHAEIIDAIAPQFRRQQNAALAQRNVKLQADNLTNEQYIQLFFRAQVIGIWKQHVSEKAKATIDEKLKS